MDAKTFTAPPWGKPYRDTLPNGLHVYRIDSLQSEGVSVIALAPIGMSVDPEIEAIQEANARLLHEAPAMTAILYSIVASDPIYDDPDDGPFCRFCFANASRNGGTKHTADCEWIAAGAILARIEGREA